MLSFLRHLLFGAPDAIVDAKGSALVAAVPYLGASLLCGYLLARFRVLPRRGMQAWFVVTAPPFILAARIGCELANAVGKVLRWPRDRINNWCVLAFSGSLTLWMKVNPQIRVTMDERSRRLWQSIPLDKPSVMLMNHTSFCDALIIGYYAPIGYQSSCRVMYMRSLAKIPVVGACWPLGQHFPVYFLRNEEGKFSVDVEKQKAVTEDMIAYLKRGGRLMLFPEGAVTKTPDGPLQPFRHGTFKLLVEQKVPVYTLCLYGVHQTWPHNAALGGYAADVAMSVNKFETRYDSGETAEQMAERARDLMQDEVRKLHDAVRHPHRGERHHRHGHN